MRFVFLGPPGAGKGTQAARIAGTYGLVHLATGDILRAAIAGKTALGQKVEDIVKRGDLVPDDIILSLIAERLDGGKAGFILDGFPRTLAQGEGLRAMLGADAPLDSVIAFNMDEAAILDRIEHRANQENRPDDTREIFQQRMKEYHAHTAPLTAFYRAEGLLQPINAMQDIDSVTAALTAIVDKFVEKFKTETSK